MLQPQGQVPDSLFGVIKGAVELAVDDGQMSGSVSVVMPGEVFTLAAVLDDGIALTEARTVQKSIVLSVPAQMVRDLAETDHDFCRAALQHATRYSRDLVRKLHGQKLRTSVERLALWMLENSDERGRIEIPFSKRTLASLLGTTPESLSRVLASLDRVVTRRPDRTYQIEDHERSWYELGGHRRSLLFDESGASRQLDFVLTSAVENEHNLCVAKGVEPN